MCRGAVGATIDRRLPRDPPLHANLAQFALHFAIAGRWTSSAQPWQPACTLRRRLHLHRL